MRCPSGDAKTAEVEGSTQESGWRQGCGEGVEAASRAETQSPRETKSMRTSSFFTFRRLVALIDKNTLMRGPFV
ncbi:hypothetical protein E2C01_003500 [Portunus trituberculatus]|uniref:Uncharacterized protein n=1 Tax=Portunus trituberculatus TaxID=210409 RepID=A0A5B7CR88_PORTR|nr:hypothetical protein [Portunus trituberculatus]